MKNILIKDISDKITFQKRLYKNKYLALFKNKFRCNKLSNRFSRIFNYFCLIIFIVIYYLYYLSLEKCFEGHRVCTKKTEWIQKKLYEGLSCGILLLIMWEFMIQKIVSKLHLLHVFLVFLLFYLYSHDLEFYDHGLFNFLGVISLLIIGNIIILPINIFFYLLKINKLLFIYIIFLIIFLISFNYYLNNFLGCKDWQKGLNNTYIENTINKYSCKVKIPKYCPYKFMKYLFDVTERTGVKCGISSDNKKNILKFSKSKYINETTKRIGFPRTNTESIWSDKSNQKKQLSKIISENLIDMDNQEILKSIKNESIPEIIVDFSENEKGKMIINMQFNKSLSMERKKLEKEYQPYSDNIMILYFDSISRVTGIRQLKKTLSFFERFMPYNSEQFHSFQFFKYHAFKHYTPGNFPKLFEDSYRNKHKSTRITYFLKKYGFITAFSNDMCFNYPYPNTLNEFTKEELCDHEFLLCDPNRKHINSITKRCLYEKTDIDYQYEYGLQFWKLYKNNRKFLMIVSNDGHEGTLEVIKYDDDVVFNFLNSLYKDNLLEETTILLLSDHGCPMPSIYYFNDFFQREKHLPMLFLMIPNKINETYYQQFRNIYENQQRFITAYDIYNTLCFLMLGNNYYYKKKKSKTEYIFESKLGINLFEPINVYRDPGNYSKMKRTICN